MFDEREVAGAEESALRFIPVEERGTHEHVKEFTGNRHDALPKLGFGERNGGPLAHHLQERGTGLAAIDLRGLGH